MPQKKGKKQIETPPIYWITDADVEIVPIKGKGYGLKARRPLPANARLVYTGKEITSKQRKKLIDRIENAKAPGISDFAEYIVSSGRGGIFIDAHHRYPGGPRLASYINEPNTGETANMLLKHREIDGKLMPVMITVHPIEPNTELTVKYGSGFKRVGYRPGRRAKEPKWKI